MKILTYLSAATLTLVSFTATAQAQMPKVEKPIPGKNVILSRLSNNGKWAVSESGSVTDGDLRPIGGYIYNMENYEQTPVTSESGYAGVSDVSDDGNIVVGECNGLPAYWDKRTGSWTILAFKEAGFDHGRLNAVTPDGRYAAGVLTSSRSELLAQSIVFDLQTGERVDLSGMPTLDQSHQDRTMSALYEISPDGRYVVGMLSQAYLMDTIDGKVFAPLCTFVYDIQEKTYDMIGFNDLPDKDWEKLVPNLHFVSGPEMSNNGEWITGSAYMVEEIPGSEWPNEAYHAFRYNVKTKEMEVYSDLADADIAGFAIDNNGVVYGATPAENPYSNGVVRCGDYFITIDQIFKQVYNYDFAADSGYTITGKPLAISDDGRTVIMLPDTDGCYVLKMPEPLAEAAAKVKLLGSYNVTPLEGVRLSRLTSITINFDRNVKVRGNSSKVTFESADGKEKYNPVSSNGVVADGKKVTITFRSRDLTDGMDYTLTIPEGMIRMDGKEDETNEEIKITYKGRGNMPVKALEILPENDSYVQILDPTSSPILINFDAELQLVSGARGELYRNEETNPFCYLNIAVAGDQALLFPTSGEYLYLDNDYHVVIPAGSLTDISGGGANEEISFTYHGTYIRNFVQDDFYIFNEDCSDYSQMMFYDGDNRQPDPTVAEWGFTSDTTPWFIVRDDADTNMAFASHSMYVPAGKADDWAVIPQLMIPDEKCYLQFLAQSFHYDASDILDVYVYPCESVYNIINAGIANDIRTKGDHVFSEQLYPGDDEETLAGDWGEYTVDLSKYAGQGVYIAFVNQNDNQSAIFIDDIRVVHDTAFATTFETPARVVNQKSVPVSGYILFNSERETYNSIKLTLTDAEGTIIDKIEEDGLNLTKGDKYNFKFKNEVPVKLGETTTYYVEVSLDGAKPSKMTGKVANLTFQPQRRIVLEEYTGSECGNCPLGIRAMENINMLYPNVMIPITIRTYQDDRLGRGMGAYSQFLGLDQLGAPSAIIDRKEAAYPMISVEGDYRFTGNGIPSDIPDQDERVWLDVFRTQYETPAELGIYFESKLDEDAKKVNVSLYIENALNKHRCAYKVFAVITEDGLTTYQKNYMSGVADPDLGEWGAGGQYATNLVMGVEAHGVARQTWGTTYNGTTGHFPADMKAGWGYTTEFSVDIPNNIENIDNCNMIVMIIDENNQVVNANICELRDGKTDATAVETVTDAESAIAGMAVIDGKLYINAEGNFAVNAYDMAGAAILSAKGTGYTALPLNGYKGILLVKAVDAQGNAKTAKFIVR